MRSCNVEKIWKELLGQAPSRETRGIPNKREGKKGIGGEAPAEKLLETDRSSKNMEDRDVL